MWVHLVLGNQIGGGGSNECLDERFVRDQEGLFLLAPVGASKGSEDVEAGSGALDEG